MGLMLPAYRYFGYTYYWPAWVHMIVIALMGVAAAWRAVSADRASSD